MNLFSRYSLFVFLVSLFSCSKETGYVHIENEILSVSISPVGAELMSIQSKLQEKEYLWQGDPVYWAARAPIMFPVNVRFENEQFVYKEKKYDMPRMGLAVDAPFVIHSKTNEKVVFEFESSPEIIRNQYPFPFRLQVSYSLEENQLINEFIVTNKGEDTMYFALGGHPGIFCPFENGKSRKDYQISFFDTITIGRNLIAESLFHDTLLPFLNNENSLNLADERIPDGGMFLKNSPIRKFGIGYNSEKPYAIVHLGDFPNVNIWTPPGKPYVCIEPMVSHHDIVNSPLEIQRKKHLIAIPGSESRKYSFLIEININYTK